MIAGESPSLDELIAIMNLERQEAFDDVTSDFSDHDRHETAEEKLMKIIDKPLPGIPKEKQDLFRRSQEARKRSSRSRYSYIASGGGTVTTNKFQFADPLDPEKEEWRKTLNRSLSKENAFSNDMAGIQRVSSNSSAGGPNQPAGNRRARNQRGNSARSLTMDGTESLTSTDTRNTANERRGRRAKNNSSPNPASVSSLNDSVDDKESSFSSNDHVEDGKPPAPRKVRRASKTQPEDTQPKPGQPPMRGRRRGSRDAQTMRTSSQDAQGNRANSQGAAPGEGSRRGRRSTSKGKMATFEQTWADIPDNGDQRVGPIRKGATQQKRTSTRQSANMTSFEQAWEEGEADNGDQAPASIDSNLRRSMTTDSANKKITKREKIFELQAKCDRYKKEWIEASKEKKKVRKELQDVQVSIVSLNMQIDTQQAETEILQRQLTDAVQKLKELKKVQEREPPQMRRAAHCKTTIQNG